MAHNLSIEQYLCSKTVSLADVAAMLLQELRIRLPIDTCYEDIPVNVAVALVSPGSIVSDKKTIPCKAA